MNGDKVGVPCGCCHAITDGSVCSMPRGGSIESPHPFYVNDGSARADMIAFLTGGSAK